ncbi:MAG: VCBS repeat-containing protein, partial [Lentisphaeria bacterium]|nr:VCBS repeat-containing protein [Lentisphaeria bacterium]
ISLAYREGRIYAGGACTLEVLDLTGKLIQRYPQSWGPCRKVVFIDNDRGGYSSVSLRKNSTDGVYMWTVDSQTGKNTVKFNLNMPGYQHFPSFGSLRRSDIFVADFDGDGKQELVGDAQGMYNWLNCYDNEGNPKYQLNLGPGYFTRTWTVGDITGDKCPEIFVLTSLDQVLAVNGKCVPLWNRDIPFRGASLITVNESQSRVLVANRQNLAIFDNTGKLLQNLALPRPVQKIWCRDGKVFALENSGQIIQLNI